MDINDKIKNLLKEMGEEVDDSDDLENIFSGDNLSLSDEEYDKIKEEFGVDLKDLENQFMNYQPKKEIYYSKIEESVIDPKYVYESDSGFDLHSTEDLIIKAFDRALVPTGLRFDIPDGNEIQVRPKSGLALKLGLTVLNTPGTIDSGYNGEIKVIMFNTTKEDIKISKGMKIAQAVLCPVINGKWIKLVEKENISIKDRNDNGFGSTGINI
jgi:dUTP pyrophosphatase